MLYIFFINVTGSTGNPANYPRNTRGVGILPGKVVVAMTQRRTALCEKVQSLVVEI